MYSLEVILVIALLFLTFSMNLRGVRREVSLAAFAAALLSLVLAVWLDQARWQMLPAYLLLLILALLLLKRSHAHVAVRSLGIVFGAALLGISVLLAQALPIVTLPPPTGPNSVGLKSFWLVDESRNEAYFDAPDEARELYLQVWYPGTIGQESDLGQPRTLWEEMYRGPRDPITLLVGYMRGIKTHTYQDLPLSADDIPPPVIVFSHSLGLSAEQNTPLMEHLASHGYVVIGINHTRMTFRSLSAQGQAVYPHPDRLNEAFTEGAAIDDDAFSQRLAVTDSPEARAELVFELGEQAIRMNEQVAIRVADLQFVMDLIETPDQGPAEWADLVENVDPDRIGLMGMSIGGATVIDTCKIDARCRAGINLDGGIFGQHQRQALQAPFLSMVSAPNQKYGEHLLLNSTSDYYEVLVEGAGHGDFCDMTFLMPFMKWLGANGSIAPMHMVKIMNAVTAEFFDTYLGGSGAGKPVFYASEFPEIIVLSNQ